jgi:hypothetical protein
MSRARPGSAVSPLPVLANDTVRQLPTDQLVRASLAAAAEGAPAAPAETLVRLAEAEDTLRAIDAG